MRAQKRNKRSNNGNSSQFPVYITLDIAIFFVCERYKLLYALCQSFFDFAHLLANIKSNFLFHNHNHKHPSFFFSTSISSGTEAQITSQNTTMQYNLEKESVCVLCKFCYLSNVYQLFFPLVQNHLHYKLFFARLIKYN